MTFYNSTDDLPPFEDYSMDRRTYRYFTGKPLYAFGFGLSYTTFDYGPASLAEADIDPSATVQLSFDLKNAGAVAGDEVSEVYFTRNDAEPGGEKMALCGLQRTHLAAGGNQRISLAIPMSRLRRWDSKQKQSVVQPGRYELLIGSSSDDIRQRVSFAIHAAN